ncbi:MAG: hypothetical protein ACI9FN_002364 [Saprospiraceae bacterium]|jgi:hypothetical protein
MNDQKLDELIKASLSAEEAEFYDQLEEQNLFNKMTLIYKGKMMWISVLQTIAMSALAIFGVYAAIKFYNVIEITSMLRWGFAALVALIAGSMVKLFLLQLMMEKSMMRELKRLELQLSHRGNSKNLH